MASIRHVNIAAIVHGGGFNKFWTDLSGVSRCTQPHPLHQYHHIPVTSSKASPFPSLLPVPSLLIATHSRVAFPAFSPSPSPSPFPNTHTLLRRSKARVQSPFSSRLPFTEPRDRARARSPRFFSSLCLHRAPHDRDQCGTGYGYGARRRRMSPRWRSSLRYKRAPRRPRRWPSTSG